MVLVNRQTTTQKKIVSLGIRPIAYKTHHTSHMHKVLGIATSRFLPVDNDIEKGGRAVKVRMDRAGRMAAAKEDSYKQVYADDGKSYTYPKIAENRLRMKGQLYFQNMEITGSKEGNLTIGTFYFRGWRKWQDNWVRKVRKEWR